MLVCARARVSGHEWLDVPQHQQRLGRRSEKTPGSNEPISQNSEEAITASNGAFVGRIENTVSMARPRIFAAVDRIASTAYGPVPAGEVHVSLMARVCFIIRCG